MKCLAAIILILPVCAFASSSPAFAPVAVESLPLTQETNAYAVLPSSQWNGFSEPPPAPPPAAGTWGDHPPLPSGLDLAAIVGREGGDLTAKIAALESDDGDPLALALARLGRLVNR